MKDSLKPVIITYLRVIAYLLLAFLLINITYLLVQAAGALPSETADMQSLDFLFILMVQATVFLLTGLLLNKLGWLKTFDLKFDITLLQVLAAIGLWFLTMMLAGITVKSLGLEVKQFAQFSRENMTSSPVVFLIAVALVAPVSEEIVFRGFVLKTLMRVESFSQGRVASVMAVIFSTVFFSLLHLDSGATIGVFIPVAFLAVFLAGLTLYTRSLGLSILMHAFHNLITGLVLIYVDIESLPGT